MDPAPRLGRPRYIGCFQIVTCCRYGYRLAVGTARMLDELAISVRQADLAGRFGQTSAVDRTGAVLRDSEPAAIHPAYRSDVSWM